MTTKKISNPSRKRIRSILFLMFGFVIWASFTIYNQRIDINDKMSKLEELEIIEQQATQTKEDLKKDVLLLQDSDYIAELARKYYFLSKPGEYIFISPEE